MFLYMRLSKKEIQVILRVAKEIYGEGVEIYLFGSRINDEKKGGDIDLLVRGSSERKGVLARIRMLARLKYFLGDQKIDIIGDHEDSPVARNTFGMTNKKQELEQRLNREFEICDRHILRIEEALDELTDLLPMSVEDYVGLNSEQIRCLDQFIFRFSKLQDAMGAKIFRNLLEYLDEDVSSLPMRDLLNLLERYRLIDKAEEWNYIRELRNEIAHDYPLLENDVVSILNELISKVPVLFAIYNRLKAIVIL